MNTLQLTEDQIIDHSIKSSQYVRYEPATGTSLNNNGTQIRFEVNLTDQFTYPAGSYLTFKGKLTKADGSLYSDTDEISLTHNGIIHLFSNIKFQVGGTEIESVNNPGHSSNMLGLLTYNDDLNNFRGLNQCWTKDTDNSTSLTTNAGFKKRQDFIIQQPNTKGNFSFAVPLNHILGFADDYDKVLYGSRQTLTLVRQHDSDAIFKKSTVAAGKITLDKVYWNLPQIEPNLEENLRLHELIESKVSFPVAFRSRHCESINVPQSSTFTWNLRQSAETAEFVIIGFQTDRDEDQSKNAALYDHCDVNNIYVTLNNKRFPREDIISDFDEHDFSDLFHAAVSFKETYHQLDSLMCNPSLNPKEYKDLYPLFVFDLSRQDKNIVGSVNDLQLKVRFGTNVPANTRAYATVISSRSMKFKSDGRKISVIQ
tara:strand:+ start:1452 stop:2729 length:1278 start_codon:yes stop_codon:yes gene_type:complete